MKRKVASRKLKRTCVYCNKNFVKGDVYYLKRIVIKFYGKLAADEYLSCSRCKYENERKGARSHSI